MHEILTKNQHLTIKHTGDAVSAAKEIVPGVDVRPCYGRTFPGGARFRNPGNRFIRRREKTYKIKTMIDRFWVENGGKKVATGGQQTAQESARLFRPGLTHRTMLFKHDFKRRISGRKHGLGNEIRAAK